MDNKTAILIDGAFLIKRYQALYGDLPEPNKLARAIRAASLQAMRAANRKNGTHRDLYRILFYDCPPLDKRVQNPVSQKGLSLGKTEAAIYRIALHDELKKQRKIALRLGRLDGGKEWVMTPKSTKQILTGKKQLGELSQEDVRLEVKQKGVDIKIGIDIASLAYKGLVNQIILVAGDSDFVPAAKLARREGVDFILDPMWNHINPDLHEHIDGLISGWQKPNQSTHQ